MVVEIMKNVPILHHCRTELVYSCESDLCGVDMSALVCVDPLVSTCGSLVSVKNSFRVLGRPCDVRCVGKPHPLERTEPKGFYRSSYYLNIHNVRVISQFFSPCSVFLVSFSSQAHYKRSLFETKFTFSFTLGGDKEI